ncbi:MAG: 16S rRNA (guanine(966)-N(2))-methyltransferase RsmD [Planctomycetota bacterium]
MKLLSPKGDQTRPIIDRVKESLFDVLYKYNLIEGGYVADLFCGTGSLGLEALSRGAVHVTFVEMDHRVVQILEKNITRGGFAAETRVITADAFKTGAMTCPEGRQYDIVFVDPPYALSMAVGLDSPLGRLFFILIEQVSKEGIVIVRTEAKVNLQDKYGVLGIIERRKWGNSAVTLLRKKEVCDD